MHPDRGCARLMNYLISYLRHLGATQAAASQALARAVIDLSDLSLRITKGRSERRWSPRFVKVAEGRTIYVDHLTPDIGGFAGWLPYPTRQWAAASDKSVFKQFASQHDIATPAACVHPSEIGGPFLVKKVHSSFGEGIRGPFLAYDGDAPAQQLAEGEYYENFIVGHIAKAWYWGTQLLVLELKPPPVVIGDEKTSLRELLARVRTLQPGSPDWVQVECLARFCGLRGLDDVPAEGKEVLIDFKYGSRYEPFEKRNLNVLPRFAGSALGARFQQAGEALCETIGVQYPKHRTLFTLDAIVDSQGMPWFLEMNSNPMVHPDLYKTLLRDDLEEELAAA